VTGGMQDWSYLQGGTYELTLELGCYKFPKAEELNGFWMDNRESLVKFIEQVHFNVKGFVRSSIGTLIKHAAISIDNIQHVTYTSNDGDYFRLLKPGKYNITASAKGYEPVTAEIIVPESGSLIYNINMMRNDPQHWSSAFDFRILTNILKTRYHTNEEIGSTFSELSRINWWMAQLEEDGNSHIYHSLKLTAGLGQAEETKIHVLILSSLFETSPVGREMVVNLARHVITAYNTKEPGIIELMNNTVIHFVTVNENFDNVYSQYQQNSAVCDPSLKEELGDRLLNAESDNVKDVLFKLFERDEVSLALTFTAGDDNSVQVLKDREPVYAEFSNNTQSHFGAQNQLCPSNTLRQNENESLGKITNLMYNMKLPFYSINLGCCKMPLESEIADIWREKLEKFLKFINLARTGVKGFVKDHNGNPLRNAKIVVKGSNRVYNVSKNLAFFHVIVPTGQCELQVTCDNFTTKIVGIQAGNNIVNLNEVILEPDTTVETVKHYDISGFVTDDEGTPVQNAEIGIKDNWNKKAFTNHVGQFEMKDINAESVVLTVKANGFMNSEKLVMMNLKGTTKNIIFKLAASDEDMGFRNLLFIFFICISILCSVVCVTFFAINGCSASCPCMGWFSKENSRHLTENYKFSLLTKKSNKRPTLFEDDVYGDDEEEELFSPTTLKREFMQTFET
jgi:carboxypeptidase D